MRKARFIAVAVLAAFGVLAAVAFAGENQYNLTTTKVSPNGGTKKKPKPVGITVNFSIKDADGTIPDPVRDYSFSFEGVKVNTSVLPSCTAASMNAAKSDSDCPSKAVWGTGSITARAGSTDTPVDDPSAIKCNLDLKLYNSGTNKAALWLEGHPNGEPAQCAVDINEAIPATFKKKGANTVFTFRVPDSLLEQVTLPVAVIDVKTKIKKIKATGSKKKKVGYFVSTGCSDKKRDVSVIFAPGVQNGAGQPWSSGPEQTVKNTSSC
ncbi:MAG: hypothetical protein HZB46_05090 [Solirubrobacterales bacterium]|nr:hypothetical protein [Solirubrobacterales bacterium]